MTDLSQEQRVHKRRHVFNGNKILFQRVRRHIARDSSTLRRVLPPFSILEARARARRTKMQNASVRGVYHQTLSMQCGQVTAAGRRSCVPATQSTRGIMQHMTLLCALPAAPSFCLWLPSSPVASRCPAVLLRIDTVARYDWDRADARE